MRNILLSTFFVLALTFAASSQVALQQGGSQLTQVRGAGALSGEPAKLYRHWSQQDDAPSAFLRVGDNVAVVVRSHSSRDLDRMVQGHCQFLTSKDLRGQPCVVVAKKQPNSRNPRSGGVSLNRQASDFFASTYQQRQKPGKYGAFAISPNGRYGYSFNFHRENGAKRRAVQECNEGQTIRARVGTQQIGISKLIVVGVANQLRLKCVVVHVHRP